MAKATEGELSNLHGLLARYLADKVASGEANASDISNAIKFLKDNNISSSPDDDEAVERLRASLINTKGVPSPDHVDLSEALDKLDFISGAN